MEGHWYYKMRRGIVRRWDNMWKELKEKLPKKVKWSSDGEIGEGELVDINIGDNFIHFTIDDKVLGRFSIGSRREFIGIVPDDKLHISGNMGDIIIMD